MKRILYVILSLALLVGLLVPAATPIHAEVLPKVAVLTSTGGNLEGLTDVKTKLDSTGLFSQVDTIRVDPGPDYPVPTLARLQQYSAVMVYSNGPFNNPEVLGNVLADYLDAGGGVVVATKAFYVYDPYDTYDNHFGIGGRISSAGYLPFTQGFNESTGNNLTYVDNLPSHPILSGVTSFNGGSSSIFNNISLASGATLVAHWSNGYPLIATKTTTGRVVGLNFFPPSSDSGAGLWDSTTDGARIMANSLIWAGGGTAVTVKAETEGTPLAASIDWSTAARSATSKALFYITSLEADAELSLTAPASYTLFQSSYAFDHWSAGGTEYGTGDRDITFTANGKVTATAHYNLLSGPINITDPHAELEPSYNGEVVPTDPPLTEGATNESSGWWWRDTTNQKNLWSHTNENFPNRLITAYAGPDCKILVFVSQGGSNVVAVIGPTGNTVIGCGGSRAVTKIALSEFANAVPGFQVDLRGIIYTDCNHDTNWGGAEFVGVNIYRSVPLQIYCASSWMDVSSRNQAASTAHTNHDLYTMGPAIPYGPDGNLGTGSELGFNPYQPDNGLIIPNKFIGFETPVTLGGVTMNLIPSCEEDGGLYVVLPDQKVLIVGEIFGKYFPPIGAPTGPDIPITKWISTLYDWSRLNANVLVSLHALPITGPTYVMKALTDQKSALSSVHSQTIQKINDLMSEDDIVATVSLSESLASQPYVQPFTSSVANAVRATYHYYMGWFDWEADSLNTLSELQQAQFIIDLAGGPEQALAKARELEQAPFGDKGTSCQEAIIITKALRQISPSQDADVIYIAALSKLGYSQTSGQLRNYYLREAHRVASTLQIRPMLTSFAKSGNENSPISFTSADFSANFMEYGEALSMVKIVSLPSNGTFSLPNGTVVDNQEIAVDALDELVFTPDTDWYGQTSFQWNAAGSSGYYANDNALVTIDINQVVQNTASISGQVYNDANGNGSPDTGEPGLSGVTVRMTNTDDSSVQDTITAADGSYAFTALYPGTYQVRQVLPQGYLQTPPDPANIVLAEGQSVTEVNLGRVLSADLKVKMAYSINKKTITYTITVTNNGPADALQAILTGPLPGGVGYISATSTLGSCSGGKSPTCNFGTLASGSSATVILKVNRTTTGPVEYTVTVTSGVFDIDGTNNSATITVP